jgi:hypothetical protein
MGRVFYCRTMFATLSKLLFTKLFLPVFVFISLPAALETIGSVRKLNLGIFMGKLPAFISF